MIEENKKNIFNEEKARLYVNYLLENDVKTYKKLIPEIQSLNSEEFHKLFNGEDYDYNVTNKKEFKQLANKFDNFFKLKDYYEEDKYYPYIRDLWLKNICLEDLCKNDYIDILKKFDIKYEEWPYDFKEEFGKLLLSTEKTRIYDLKNKFKSQYNSYNLLIQNLRNLKQKFENKPEDKVFSEVTDKVTNTMIFPIFQTFLLNGFSMHANSIINEATKISGQKTIISNIISEIDFWNLETDPILGKKIDRNRFAQNLFNKFKTLIEKDSDKTYALGLDLNDFSKSGWYESSNYGDLINLDYEIRTKNGEIIYENGGLNIKEMFETILKDEVSSLAILAASVLNIGWSIYNFNIISEEYKNLVKIDEEFETIKERFNSHKRLLEKLPDRIIDAINYIKGIIDYIKDDYTLLKKHINGVEQKKEEAESIKTQSMIGMGVSLVLGLFSLGGSIISIGQNLFTATVNGISTAGNAYALNKHYTNYELSKEVIRELNEKIKRANEFGNEMNNFINKLIDELKSKENEIPKFCDFEIIENYY